jgi:hypothetical protein
MKSNDPWQRLAEMAKSHREPELKAPAEMPFGFSSRVLSRLRRTLPGGTELWARLALRAVPLGAAALLLFWLMPPAGRAMHPPLPDEVEQLMQEVMAP